MTGSNKRQVALEGIPVSPGIVVGKAFILDHHIKLVEPITLKSSQLSREVSRFEKAVSIAKDQIRRFRNKVKAEVGEAEAQIFDSHLTILEDPMIIDSTITGINNEARNAEYIFQREVKIIVDKLQSIADEYISQRSTDIEDVARRVINILQEQEGEALRNLTQPVIVIARDLGPSDTAHLSPDKVIAFATDHGGPTSHTAIMASALEIPAVVGVEHLTDNAQNDDLVIVDGIKGQVILRPTKKQIAKYENARKNYQLFVENLEKHETLPAETMDGYTIDLAANIELPDEIPHLFKHGCDRIGLFRTEFIYLRRPAMIPSEDEQFEVYRSVAAAIQPNPVIVRTLDLGGDKFVSAVPIAHEFNPYLGLRAIRLCLEYPEIFRQQLRAMLRASVYGNIHIMFPMVSNLTEVRRAKKILEECRESLRKHKIAFKEDVKVGIMIETPSAAVLADHLAEEVDFFSIGTNDLIQYTLAVDRGNEQVAHLYEPYHPSVLRLIFNVVRVAQKTGIWTSLCGEMAGDPLMAILLLGMGVDELSMGPVRIPLIKEVVRHVYLPDAKQLANEVLQLKTASEVRRHVYSRMSGLLPNSEWIFAGAERELPAVP